MKNLKFLQKLYEFKNEFYNGKKRQKIIALIITNIFLIEIIYLIFSIICIILFYFCNNKLLPSCIIILVCLNIIIIIMQNIVLSKITPLISNLTIKFVFWLSKNGSVITKNDWKDLKKNDRRLYNNFWRNKKYYGHCYYFSRALALKIKEAKLLYCSIKKDGEDISHAVILKGDVVFDTNLRMHCNLAEYIEENEAKIYKIFSKDEYEKSSFFDDIRDDLVKYCFSNNIYCTPQ